MRNHTNYIISTLVCLFALFLVSTNLSAQVIAERILQAANYFPGLALTVQIKVTGEPVSLRVTEIPNAGWSVKSIILVEILDQGIITWDKDSFSGSMTLQYQVTPPAEFSRDAIFTGNVNGQEISGIKELQAYQAPFQIGTPVNLGASINSNQEDLSPFISKDNLTLLFTRYQKGQVQGANIWMATRSRPDAPWTEPVELGPSINYSGIDTYSTLSWDGLHLFYTSEQPGGFGSYDIWVSSRPNASAPWASPVNAGANVNTPYGEWSTSLSQNGLTLYFSSNRPDGFGDYDIWVTTRPTLDAPWEPAVNLGENINTSSMDGGVCLAADSLSLIFLSRGLYGFGGMDLYVTSRETVNDPWSRPINLGAGMNTIYDEYCASLSADGSILYFSDFTGAPRPGGMGGSDIWYVTLQKIQSSVQYWMMLR